MKKIKFYLLFWLVIVAISSVGILLGMFFAIVEDKHPEYLSVGLFKGFIIFVVALFISVYLHEISHAIAFKVQGIGIRMIYVFPICIVWEKERLRVRMAVNMQIGFGGLVIPQIPVIHNQTEYKRLQNSLSISLLCGPLCSALLGIISGIALLYTEKYVDTFWCSYYFLFFCAMVIWAIYINVTSFFNFGGLVGDYLAAKKIKADSIYSLVQIYNFFILQTNDIKKEMRLKQKWFMNEMYKTMKNMLLDEDSDSMYILLVDAVVNECLVAWNKTDFPQIDVAILKTIIQKNYGKRKFESYFKLFSHIVMYMYLAGNEEDAIGLWEKYKTDKSNTNVGDYCFKQVEWFLYRREIDKLTLKESIKISSWDSLLSVISNYYDDEIMMNELCLIVGGEVWKSK